MRILQCMGYSPCICKTGALAVCACLQWQEDSHTAYLAMQLSLHTWGCFAALFHRPMGRSYLQATACLHSYTGLCPPVQRCVQHRFVMTKILRIWHVYIGIYYFSEIYITFARFVYTQDLSAGSRQKIYEKSSESIYLSTDIV